MNYLNDYNLTDEYNTMHWSHRDDYQKCGMVNGLDHGFATNLSNYTLTTCWSIQTRDRGQHTENEL